MLKTHLNTLALLILSLGLQGCEVDVDDGKIPPEYMSAAQAYVGTYTGQMDSRPGSIVLTMKEDGFVEVATPGFEGDDILGEGCGSEIGPLLAIEGKQPKDKTQPPVLKRLDFGFHRTAWQCVSMQNIYFDFGQDEQGRTDINVSLPLFLTGNGNVYTIFGYFVKQ